MDILTQKIKETEQQKQDLKNKLKILGEESKKLSLTFQQQASDYARQIERLEGKLDAFKEIQILGGRELKRKKDA